jgi:choline kinase
LRAHDEALPKPLTVVAGKSLLERAVLVCRDAGVSEVVVVVGFRQDVLLPVLDDLRRRLDVSITAAVSSQWWLGNGASVLAARPVVSGAFFLLMCDHLVTSQSLVRLRALDDGACPCTVAVDRRVELVPDLEEATKTRLVGDRVTRIEKGLLCFDAVDTGVFLCREGMFEALHESAGAGRHSLSEAVQLLADRGQVRAADCSGLRWMDVDTQEDLARAEFVLRAERAQRAASETVEAGQMLSVPPASGPTPEPLTPA